MAGQVRRWAVVVALTFATAVGAVAQSASDQVPVPPNPPGSSNPPGTTAPGPGGPGEKWREWRTQHPGMGQGGGQAFENVRKAIEALTPEQRKRFQENFQRWMNLSPEEKKVLREREEMRRKTMEEEIQTAIQESGLQLDGERREQFVKRYTEERRTIEEELHKEMAEKRRPLVKQLVSRLRTEFAAQGAAPATSAPQSSSSETTIRASTPETPKP